MVRIVVALGGALLLGIAVGGAPARAEDPSFALTLKDHQFSPAEVEVPANTKVKLVVKNTDATPEEFESAKLHREKVVPAGQEIAIPIGPLKPGRYEFVGDFNRATAHGTITAK
ncbi:MAG: cupredoxin domain-containing protein [Alphaproteobacteria bacterium]|nr:cupredoxin domain-containing protein [Alphaproteobacteria bacterium]